MNKIPLKEARTAFPLKKIPASKIGWRDNVLAYTFLGPALLILSVFLVIPSIMAVYYAFTDYYLLTPDLRKFVGFDNFIKLFKDPIFLKSLSNTLKFVVLVIPLQIGAALGLALLLNKKRKANTFFKVAYFSPVVMSLVVISVLWLYLLNPNEGMINNVLTHVGLPPQPFLTSPNQAIFTIVFVSVWQGAGFQMLIFLAGLQNIPGDVYEAAQLDGMNKWQRFIYITLPLLKPTSVFIFITTLISAFKLLVQPMVMTQGGPVNSTMTVVYYIYQTGFTDRMVGYASSIALLFGTIIGLVTLAQRKLVKEDEGG
ncbi:sugar ABC transporter permease [Bacillus licheniformis]|jgi:fructooligosaccharide transport system permease protein|uniref:Binding-protein-dependent transport systems inner membrane component n=1 Tax=Bacillus licheniformis (strain ATCC 14580 / DSM 13 / JCM 2505 / CCUG 7422 / NBRC 12200 / NCIMB 9375 / NCTC 10341 / NRRL NRS-1264 / Gibson 46) TaxID=279010 RepID=Q65D70_BACLD|nr:MULTISPECIES: sugar ABC transporter permease [Bacillus]AAU25615.1 Binding-protein-dependent transport systems inner membrane component [Bacillus licheniformis DSM 13 = ATCC 14580]AAU42994.1 carbohydrate ABC transporter permease [Bacillus licheniformis DSM 13 = ATCC 14580]ARC61005.1 lactose transport system permease protein LacF [Bacillus licheniformis]ARC63327.1 lactose transport system permease protein LacF [Bacillus licheniformis]ARC70236.1 lactose transport system permease protein LacF [